MFSHISEISHSSNLLADVLIFALAGYACVFFPCRTFGPLCQPPSSSYTWTIFPRKWYSQLQNKTYKIKLMACFKSALNANRYVLLLKASHCKEDLRNRKTFTKTTYCDYNYLFASPKEIKCCCETVWIKPEPEWFDPVLKIQPLNLRQILFKSVLVSKFHSIQALIPNPMCWDTPSAPSGVLKQ